MYAARGVQPHERFCEAKRNATVRRSLARGRAPGNVAGVEKRGDGGEAGP